MQLLLGPSDRQAGRRMSRVVRCRIDFTYALAMELGDPGFHHSVPADFRERLAQDDRADLLLDLVLVRPKEAGLVCERTTQRADSTHVLAVVRDLTWLEPVTEAVRVVLEEVARTADHLLTGLVDENWGRRNGRPVRPGKNPSRPRTWAGRNSSMPRHLRLPYHQRTPRDTITQDQRLRLLRDPGRPEPSPERPRSMPDEAVHPLSDLHPGERVQATITGHQPWGVTAKIHGYEPVGASLDVIRRGSEPGVSQLARDLPAVGSTIELVVGEVRPWHRAPWIWVDLTSA
jgi:hypothetical protein